MLFAVIHDAIFAGIAALGFAIIFSVPPRYLLYVTAIAMFGFAARSCLTHFGFGVELATLAGAFCIGVMGRVYSKIENEPHHIVTIAASIPMVPGVMAFKAILALLDFTALSYPSTQYLTSAVYYGSKTAFILAALAFGVAAPSLIKKR